MIWRSHPKPDVMARRDEIVAGLPKLLSDGGLVADSFKGAMPDLNAAGNIAGIARLAGDSLPVVHTVALLDWKAVGPHPSGLPG